MATPIKKPGTIIALLKKAKTAYQREKAPLKPVAEDRHTRITKDLAKLRDFAVRADKNGDPGPFDGVKIQTVKRMKDHFRAIKSPKERAVDPNKATLDKYLKTFAALTWAVKTLAFSALEDGEDEANLDALENPDLSEMERDEEEVDAPTPPPPEAPTARTEAVVFKSPQDEMKALMPDLRIAQQHPEHGPQIKALTKDILQLISNKDNAGASQKLPTLKLLVNKALASLPAPQPQPPQPPSPTVQPPPPQPPSPTVQPQGRGRSGAKAPAVDRAFQQAELRKIEGPLLFDEIKREAENVKQAFADAGIQDSFDIFWDAGTYDPKDADKIEGSPKLKALAVTLAGVQKRAARLKEIGAPLEDVAAAWEAVPIGFRPDAVVAELAPYYLVTKALQEEPPESKAQSWDAVKARDLEANLDIVNTVVGAVGGAGFKELKEIPQFVLLLRDLHTAYNEFRRQRRERGKKGPADPNPSHNPDALLAARVKTTKEQLVNILTALAKISDALSAHASLFTGGDLVALSDAIGLVTDLLTTARWLLSAWVAVERMDHFDAISAGVQPADAAYLDPLQALYLGEERNRDQALGNAATTAVGAVGKGLNVAGVVGAQPELKLAGQAVKAVGAVATVALGVWWAVQDSGKEKEIVEDLRLAALGHKDAKMKVMRESQLYAKMFIALGAKEGNPVALAVLETFGFDEKAIEEHSVYVVRKALLWATANQADKRPGEDPFLDDLRTGATNAAAKVSTAAEQGIDKVRGKNQSAAHHEPEAGYPAAFALANWEQTKKAAFADGIKESATGIAAKLKEYEDYADKYKKIKVWLQDKTHAGEVGECAKKLDTVLAECYDLFRAYEPQWITPHPTGAAPQAMHTYRSEMMEKAALTRTALQQDWAEAYREAQEKWKANGHQEPSYPLPSGMPDAASFAQVWKTARQNGVIADGAMLEGLLKDVDKANAELYAGAPLSDKIKELLGGIKQKKPVRPDLEKAVACAQAVAMAFGTVNPENEWAPGVDAAFRQYAEAVARSAEKRRADYQKLLDLAISKDTFGTWTAPTTVQLTSLAVVNELAKARRAGLSAPPADKVVAALDQVAPFLKVPLEIPADPKPFWMKAQKAFVALTNAISDYRGKNDGGQPELRKYLDALSQETKAELKGVLERKQPALV